jgi:acyl-CoA thioester hydrolase
MIKPLEIQIRFSDCDMMGHVNNAVYLNYFELTRIYYFRELLGKDWDWRKNGIILRKNEIEYFVPVF